MGLNELKTTSIDIQSYLLLKKGIKPVIRVGTTKDGYKSLKNFCKNDGLFIKIGFFKKLYRTKYKKTSIHAYISLEKKLALKALDAEKREDRIKLGELLGYPDCCVENFIKNYTKDLVIVALLNVKNKPSFYCNNIFNFDSKVGDRKDIYLKNRELFHKSEHVFLIPHVPCSFDCAKSIAIGKETLKLLEKEVPEFAGSVVNILKRPFLYFDYFRWVVFDGSVKGNKLAYDGILPVVSLIERGFLDSLRKGNEVEVSDEKITILKSGETISEFSKNKKHGGVIIRFE